MIFRMLFFFITYSMPAFSIPVNCLSPEYRGRNIGLSGKDIYFAGYPNIELCRYPFKDNAREVVTGSDFVGRFVTSSEGMFVVRKESVEFIQKLPIGKRYNGSEYVGPATTPLNIGAPFFMAAATTRLVALVIGEQSSIYHHVPEKDLPWQITRKTTVPANTYKAQLGANGFYTLKRNEASIVRAHLNSNRYSTLKCPGVCKDFVVTENGVFALSDGGVYFFDLKDNRKTLLKDFQDQDWVEVYGIQGAGKGALIQALRATDGKQVLYAVSESGSMSLVAETKEIFMDVLANEEGILFQDSADSGKWQFVERTGLN